MVLERPFLQALHVSMSAVDLSLQALRFSPHFRPHFLKALGAVQMNG